MATKMDIILATFPASVLSYLSSLKPLNKLLIQALSKTLRGNVKARWKIKYKHIIYKNHICFLCQILCNQYYLGFIKRIELYSILQYRKYSSYQSSNLHFIMLSFKPSSKIKGLSPLMSVRIYNLNITYHLFDKYISLLLFPCHFKYSYFIFQSGYHTL